MDNLEGIP